jgi:cytochrome P450
MPWLKESTAAPPSIREAIAFALGSRADDVHQFLAERRNRTPVLRLEARAPCVAVYDYGSCRTVLVDQVAFSSAPVRFRRIGDGRAGTLTAEDGEPHRAERAQLGPALHNWLATHDVSASIESALEATNIHQLSSGSSLDLMSILSRGLAVRLFADILGLPASARPVLEELTQAVLNLRSDWRAAVRAQRDLCRLLNDDVCRVSSDSLLASLRAGVPRRAIGSELSRMVRVLVPAAIETTWRAMGNVMYVLLQQSSIWFRLSEGREAVAPLIDEALRLEPSVMSTVRTPTARVRLGAEELQRGEFVIVSIGAANRDPAVFERPAEVRPERVAPALTFGLGSHACPGARLARLELRAVVEYLAHRFPGLRLLDDRNCAPIGWQFRGPSALRVQISSG